MSDASCIDTSAGIRLVAATNVQPGWTCEVKSAGGTSASDTNRVEIRFESRATGKLISLRAGKDRDPLISNLARR